MKKTLEVTHPPTQQRYICRRRFFQIKYFVCFLLNDKLRWQTPKAPAIFFVLKRGKEVETKIMLILFYYLKTKFRKIHLKIRWLLKLWQKRRYLIPLKFDITYAYCIKKPWHTWWEVCHDAVFNYCFLSDSKSPVAIARAILRTSATAICVS